jgi:FtsH-binding integral membrane protein
MITISYFLAISALLFAISALLFAISALLVAISACQNEKKL